MDVFLLDKNNYVSEVPFTIGTGLTGEYYLWAKGISNNSGNSIENKLYEIIDENEDSVIIYKMLMEESFDRNVLGIEKQMNILNGGCINAIKGSPDGKFIVVGNGYDALNDAYVNMIEAGIMDGDYILVQQQKTANNGDIVVAMINGDYECESTVKTFYKENGHIRLQPENSTMDPIIVDACQIGGLVKGVFRYLS